MCRCLVGLVDHQWEQCPQFIFRKEDYEIKTAHCDRRKGQELVPSCRLSRKDIGDGGAADRRQLDRG